jgi:hypothetical protein
VIQEQPELAGLDVRTQSGTYHISTASGATYTIVAAAQSEGRIAVSGGAYNLENEPVILGDPAGTSREHMPVIRIGQRMLFWQYGTIMGGSSVVTAIRPATTP